MRDQGQREAYTVESGDTRLPIIVEDMTKAWQG